MTAVRIAEIAGTSAVAGVATAGAIVETTETREWVMVLIPMAVAALVGYFTARITTESRLSAIEAKLDSFANEMRRYYRLKGSGDQS